MYLKRPFDAGIGPDWLISSAFTARSQMSGDFSTTLTHRNLTLSDSIQHPFDCKFGIWQPKVKQLKPVARIAKFCNPRSKGFAGECGFKRKVHALVRKFTEPLKHDASPLQWPPSPAEKQTGRAQ